MNGWQIARQIKSLLEQAAWPDSPNEPAFGSVIVSVAPTAQGISRLRLPFAFIAPADSEVDAEEPTMELQRFALRVVHREASDPLGQAALIGGPRGASGQGSTKGRGLLELEEVILSTLGDVDKLGGVDLRLRWRSGVEASEDEELGYVVTREYRLEAWCSTFRSYPSQSRFVAADNGAGVVGLSWSLAPSRFDYFGQILRRASGSTPPATPTGGTGVAVSSSAPSITDSVGTGTFSYSLFASYDELGQNTADRFSEPVTATVVVA
jgi:hypothetical protein